MKGVNGAILEQIDALQARYVAALDAKNMNGWLDTFSENEDASYICTTAESVSANLPISLVLDDNRARLKDRVTYVTKIWSGIFADYNTRHFVQRTACQALEDGLYEVTTNYLVVNTPSENGRAELYSTGVYLDHIEITEHGARFRSKKVVTDTAVVERFMAYPI
ncbi:MAG: aromatic-ring-hydroxylating dioxygenase subunit beta [Parvularculaceae bacterium]